METSEMEDEMIELNDSSQDVKLLKDQDLQLLRVHKIGPNQKTDVYEIQGIGGSKYGHELVTVNFSCVS